MVTTSEHNTSPTGQPSAGGSTTGPAAIGLGRLGHTWLVLSQVGIGFVFLWAFLDKTFGWGYATPSAQAWIHGGSPTKGFLSHVSVGPLESTFHSMAGNTLIDWLFMLGLLAVGVTFMTGMALKPGAIAGTVMLAMMWAAEWPPATTGTAGPTMSTNPIVDYHVIYAFILLLVAWVSVANPWGLGKVWARLPVVRDHLALR